MPRSLFSASWHSVADLRPRLMPQARIHRHVYRGQVWFVVQDQSGGQYHRLSKAAYQLVLAMDGAQTVQQLWQLANQSGNAEACTQNDMVDLLVQLHAADLLQTDTHPDSAALLHRYRKKRSARFKELLLNPMSLKLPLLDPDAFLQRWAPSVAWCFTTWGGMLWLAFVLPALVLALAHGTELTRNMSDQVLASSNLLVMACVFPVVKLLHELGHAFASRVWGAPVHEMGLMFLVFAPVPYVNASASSALVSKWQRAVVAAAGMMMELFLAALALYVWLLVEPGLVRAVAYNVMVVAGVSTLIVNGNPLLRYDGYYILADLVEMPNLAQRGQKYLAYVWDRHVFGVHDLDAPHEGTSERRWLLAYTPLAWCYRVFVTVMTILFVAGQFFIVGVLIALWGLVTLIGIPLWKAYCHITRSASLQRQRARALRMSFSLVVVLLCLLFALPLPLHSRAQGVIWLPDQAMVRADGNGFFKHWLLEPGTSVKKGDALFQMEDRSLNAELKVARAQVAQFQARYRAEQFEDRAKAALSGRQLQQELAALAKLEERKEGLLARAQADGVLAAATPQDMPGRFLNKGELVAYVLDKQSLIVRVVVPQSDIDLVRTRYEGAELRFADAVATSHMAVQVRAPAGGIDELPTAALGMAGGGRIPTVADDPRGLKTIERVFLLDLVLPADVPATAFGARVHVRFTHGWEPLAWQGMRRLRQLFLSQFNV